MSYSAKVFNVMTASPSDVASERSLVKVTVYEWNIVQSIQRGIVLLPIGWETHSTPEMGARPQQIINKQVLDKCDLLVGIFWTRLGTSTGEYASGTVEEIERHIKSHKPTMLYFSTAPVLKESVDSGQYLKLQEFKESCRSRGLFETYDSNTDFKDKFYRQLQLKINEDKYFRVAKEELQNPSIVHPLTFLNPALSNEARILLKEARLDTQGTILYIRTAGGTSVQTNGKNLIVEQSPREVAKWEAALNELIKADLILARGHRGEVFSVTDLGYKVADTIEL